MIWAMCLCCNSTIYHPHSLFVTSGAGKHQNGKRVCMCIRIALTIHTRKKKKMVGSAPNRAQLVYWSFKLIWGIPSKRTIFLDDSMNDQEEEDLLKVAQVSNIALPRVKDTDIWVTHDSGINFLRLLCHVKMECLQHFSYTCDCLDRSNFPQSMAPNVLWVGDLLLVIYLVCLSFLFQWHALAFSFGIYFLHSFLRFEIPPFQQSIFFL